MSDVRKIIHIDMDAFYASVEQRDRPELRGKPVIVGGAPDSRGVVAACSYEARAFGIHSAMASATAYRRCPAAVFVRPRFEAYRSVSAQIRRIFFEYTDLVEPLSLDEAFLDVTENKKGIPSATLIAREIRQKIRARTRGLTASAGVSYNKFLAKVASDCNKPDGITVIPPEEALAFIETLPIRKFFGVGRVTERKMRDLGVTVGADLKRFDRIQLAQLFGKSGGYYYDIARGIDHRPVVSEWIRKSVGKETTLSEDIADRQRMMEILGSLAEAIETVLRRDDRRGCTVTLKVKFFDFQIVTRSSTVNEPVGDASQIMKIVAGLLRKTEAGRKKVRLLGISVSNFTDQGCGIYRQLCLPFEDGCELLG